VKSLAADALAVVEIGGTSVKFGFAQDGKPLPFTQIVPTSTIRCADPATALADHLMEVVAVAEIAPVRVIVTVPGFIAPDFDYVLSAANVPELNGVGLATALQSRIRVPVKLERDVVLQLLGESYAGAVRGESHVLAIYFGTGIGAAYLAEGTIFRGGGWALEIGHMPMHGTGRSLPGIERDRAEVYASGRTLSDLAERRAVEVGNLFTAARTDRQLAEELALIIRDQAFATATAIALLSPRIVLIGGGVVQMTDYPKDELSAIITAHLPLPQSISPLDLRWARLGWEAAVWGAIAAGANSDAELISRAPGERVSRLA
jgi:allose kinase